MSSELILRCQFKGGQRKILDGLTKNCSVSQLQEKIFLLTSVAPHRQRVLSGFPPTELNLSNGSANLITTSIKSGDTLIVEENKKAPILGQASNSIMQNTTKALTRKTVPADNSCLFASLSYLLFGGDSSLSLDLRQLAAKCVSSDPTTFSEAVLGRPNEDYCKWILDPTHWGGGIEIMALSKYNEIEIAVVDIQSGRVDRFGQNEGYQNRVYLIYDGIHYDPLAKDNPRKSNEPIQTSFPVSDVNTLMEASSLATEAREKRQFTNLSGFALRCITCQTVLKGQSDATNHALSTGHTNFGEV